MDVSKELIAREEIRDILHQYCKGIDRRDWDLVRSCFADDHQHSHGAISGDADKFLEMASGLLSMIPKSHHSISNVHFNFSDDGQSVETEANFVAYHYITAGNGASFPFIKNDEATDWIVAGRYCDTFKKRDGRWIIVKRQGIHDWERSDPAAG